MKEKQFETILPVRLNVRYTERYFKKINSIERITKYILKWAVCKKKIS